MRRKKVLIKVLAMVAVMGLMCATGVMAGEETITGTVEQNDAGNIIISADNGESFMVKGQDLSSMVGKSVQVTGTLEEDAGMKSIMVTTVEEVKE